MKEKIVALVPVRKGSCRVKNKNIKSFAKTNLLEIKIKSLLNVPLIDEIIVTSDSKKMLDIASKYNVTVHEREEYFASSECTNSEFFENLSHIGDSKFVIYSPVTCPLVSTETYNDAISFFLDNNEYDSLITAKLLKHHMWLDNKPINYDPLSSPNSQDLPNILAITYGVCILERSLMRNMRNIIGVNPYFYILDEIESIDIDTEFDFMVAEHVFKVLKGLTE